MEQIEACDINNVIHAAKIDRYGEAHKQKAQSYMAKAKGEVEKATKERNSSNNDRGKHFACSHKRADRQAADKCMQRPGHQQRRKKGTDHQQSCSR